MCKSVEGDGNELDPVSSNSVIQNGNKYKVCLKEEQALFVSFEWQRISLKPILATFRY